MIKTREIRKLKALSTSFEAWRTLDKHHWIENEAEARKQHQRHYSKAPQLEINKKTSSATSGKPPLVDAVSKLIQESSASGTAERQRREHSSQALGIARLAVAIQKSWLKNAMKRLWLVSSFFIIYQSERTAVRG